MKNHFQKFIASTHWHQTLGNLKENFTDKFFINSDNNEVCVTSVQAVFEEISNVVEKEVKDFEDLHEVSTHFLHVQEGVLQFMKQYQVVKIGDIKGALSKVNSKIQICHTRKDTGVEITGTKDGVRVAKMRLNSLMNMIKTDTYSIISFGATDFFSSEDGHDKIRVIATVEKCVIHIKTATMQNRTQSRILSTPPDIRAVCRIGDGRKISVAMGDMTQFSVDVMVNAANENLEHGSGLAGAIVDAGM